MRIVRRTAVVAVIAVAALLCSTTARAAGVLDQVPQDAYIVIKVNNLEGTSKKIGKWAEQLGLNQLAPQFADPLGTFEKEVGITQGLDRSGEMAFVFVNPDTVGGNKEEAMFVLAPTKDYKAFSGNFKSQGLKDGANGVSSFKDKNDQQKDIYIAQWGNFAAISPSQALVGKKPAAGALKLSSLAARSGNEQDVLIYFNIPAVRNAAMPALDKLRGEAMKEFDRQAGAGAAKPGAPGAAPGAAAGPDAMAKEFAPLMKVMVDQYVNIAKRFLNETDGAFVGLRLSDVGLNATMGADFAKGSYLGDLATKTKNSNADLMAGLPARKYFAFGGMAVTKETFQKLINDFADPFAKELAQNGGGNAKDISTAVEAMKKSAGSIESFAFGYTVPTGALGADSVIQSVAVTKGDAQALTTTEDQMLDAMSKIFSSLNQGAAGANAAAAGAPKMSFERQPEGKTVGGVKLKTYKFNMEMDENNPQAAQMQQMMTFIYGPNGMGGAYGAVDPKTFIVVQGGTDKLITDTIASAKAGTDPLSKLAPVQAVNKQLPAERVLVEYVDLAQIVTSAVKYAQAFAPNVKMQLPQNLPPIGISAGTSGGSVRFDVHVPTSLLQSLVSAGMQTYMQIQGGGGGRGGAAQPDGL
jgi:hypothetical protein